VVGDFDRKVEEVKEAACVNARRLFESLAVD
jgi:hypothetical protein